MGKLVNIADLQTGMMVSKVIEQSGPVKIRKVGMIRSPDMIKGLKEMGVSVVEVDLTQSIQMEDEYFEDIANVSEGTATQRLLVSDKQIADADRNLSQQFHRSLFMPAVDQMPSKWTLYGKPYTLLSLVIASGFCIGWFSTVGVKTALSPPLVVNQSPVEGNGTNTEATTKAPNSFERKEEPKQAFNKNEVQAEENLTSMEGEDFGRLPSKVDNQQSQNEASDITYSQTTLDSEQIAPLVNTRTEDTANARVEPQSVSRFDVNSSQSGLALEEGQRVLGYQGEELEESSQTNVQNQAFNNTSTTNAASVSTGSDDTVNNDLLRKIQEAAQAVDSQAQAPLPDPITVTDLNDVVRIDQLSPAILTQMPEMSFSAHMYASDPRDRWVRVNSRRLGQGDFIAEGLMVKRIEPEKVILSFKGTDFSMNALSDW